MVQLAPLGRPARGQPTAARMSRCGAAGEIARSLLGRGADLRSVRWNVILRGISGIFQCGSGPAWSSIVAMTQPRLTVVIPTRDRPHALLTLLRRLAQQTLPLNDFEVVVVDDASDPPVDRHSTVDHPFRAKLLRQPVQSGSHESRWAGVREASGQRILFLDDDVVPDPRLLAEHACAEGGVAIGPILYDPSTSTTPYQRFQARLYADHARAVARKGTVPDWEIYICNASGPKQLFLDTFRGVRALVGSMAITGDGWDEELLGFQLRRSNSSGLAKFLPDALVLHVDTKSLQQARRERRLHGMMQCRLLLEVPEARSVFGSYAILTGDLSSFRTWRIRLFWMFPRLFRLMATILSWLADRGPRRWVPAWACYPPMSVAFWDGMNSVQPVYRELRASLLDQSGSK
jgi:glycosyltransferase involved in cell wall biosynthesis